MDKVSVLIRLPQDTLRLLDQWVRILQEEFIPVDRENSTWPKNRSELLEQAVSVWVEHMREHYDCDFQTYVETLPEEVASSLTERRYYCGDFALFQRALDWSPVERDEG